MRRSGGQGRGNRDSQYVDSPGRRATCGGSQRPAVQESGLRFDELGGATGHHHLRRGLTAKISRTASRKILAAVQSCESVRGQRKVEIFAEQFADSSINFEVTWWTGNTPLEIRSSRDEVIRAVKRRLDASGIEIPFPQRTVWFPEVLQMRRGADEE